MSSQSHFIQVLILVLSFCLMIDANADNTSSALIKEVLTAHNHYRQLHHAEDLSWDTTLASYAKQHASQCVFKHSRGPYGENLAAGYPSISDAIDTWYGESKEYDYHHPGFSMETGHFTQLVWRGTQKVGCGYVACNGEHRTPGNYLVCEYSPRGNIINEGYFNENVLPRKVSSVAIR